MAWNTLRTDYGSEALPSTDVNEWNEDINTLRNPASANYELNEGADYTTTSTSFVDVDATNLALQITTTGGDVMIQFHGVFGSSAALVVYLDVDIDGSRVGGDDGITGDRIDASATAFEDALSFFRLVKGTLSGGSLTAATHTFKLQWKTSLGTVTLFAGAGTSGADIHPQFWVREVS